MKTIFLTISLSLFLISQVAFSQSSMEKPSKQEIKQARAKLQNCKTRFNILQKRMSKMRQDNAVSIEQLKRQAKELRQRLNDKEGPEFNYERWLKKLEEKMAEAFLVRLRQIQLDNLEVVNVPGIVALLQSGKRIAQKHPESLPNIAKYIEEKLAILEKQLMRIELGEESLPTPLNRDIQEGAPSLHL